MNRRSWRIMGLVLVVLLLGVGVLVVISRSRDRVIAEAMSPDGTWGVAVVGQTMLLGFGGVEITLEGRDGSGRALPGYVIGISRDWNEARATYSEITCGNETATLKGRVIEKTRFVP